jgi:hypothetical protein
MTPRQIHTAFFHLDRLEGRPADPHRLALEAIVLDVLRYVAGPQRAEQEERVRASKRA